MEALRGYLYLLFNSRFNPLPHLTLARGQTFYPMTKHLVLFGGAGSLGSAIAEKSLDFGFTPFVVDNLSTGKVENIRWGQMLKASFTETSRIQHRLKELNPHALIWTSVKPIESQQDKAKFYSETFKNLLSLLEVCKSLNPHSCTVFGADDSCGKMIQQILRDCQIETKTKLNFKAINLNLNNDFNAIEELLKEIN